MIHLDWVSSSSSFATFGNVATLSAVKRHQLTSLRSKNDSTNTCNLVTCRRSVQSGQECHRRVSKSTSPNKIILHSTRPEIRDFASFPEPPNDKNSITTSYQQRTDIYTTQFAQSWRRVLAFQRWMFETFEYDQTEQAFIELIMVELLFKIRNDKSITSEEQQTKHWWRQHREELNATPTKWKTGSNNLRIIWEWEMSFTFFRKMSKPTLQHVTGCSRRFLCIWAHGEAFERRWKSHGRGKGRIHEERQRLLRNCNPRCSCCSHGQTIGSSARQSWKSDWNNHGSRYESNETCYDWWTLRASKAAAKGWFDSSDWLLSEGFCKASSRKDSSDGAIC